MNELLRRVHGNKTKKNKNLLRNWSETIAYLKFNFLKWSLKSEAREENKPLNRVLSR